MFEPEEQLFNATFCSIVLENKNKIVFADFYLRKTSCRSNKATSKQTYYYCVVFKLQKSTGYATVSLYAANRKKGLP